jgi:hypothetical protein
MGVEMIHFDFVVEDVDAENIVGAIRDVALRNDELITEAIARTDLTDEQRASYISWFKSNKEYMLGLVEKMTNRRVAG